MTSISSSKHGKTDEGTRLWAERCMNFECVEALSNHGT